MALMALQSTGPPRQRGMRYIRCQSRSIWVGSCPTIIRSSSWIAAATVVALLVTLPSPRPISPSSVNTRTSTHRGAERNDVNERGSRLESTIYVLSPVIFIDRLLAPKVRRRERMPCGVPGEGTRAPAGQRDG